MTECKTGSMHIDALRDGRTVYIDGERVDDVTTHPAFRNSVASSAGLYDFQSDPENLELMTFAPDGSGKRINRSWQLPRNHREMIERRKAMEAWAKYSYGFVGRSPDHLASALAGQRIGIDVFESHDARGAKAFRDYFDYASQNDLFLTYVIINPQADRSKNWGEQEEDLVARVVDEDSQGITIRGAKMMGTSSVMANEVFVANIQPLREGEDALAFSCALPMATPGVEVMSRKSFEGSAVSSYDNPVSSRFDENDAVIYFQDVKVPWDRVFFHNNVDMARAQFHDTPMHIYQNYQSQVRLAVKLKFLIGIAYRLTETIGTIGMPPVREQLGKLAAKVGMVEAMVDGMETNGSHYGEYWVPNKHYLYSAQVITQELYPLLINTVRELSGGALIMLPSSHRDWSNPHTSNLINKTQKSAKYNSQDKVKFLKAAWDVIGSEFASRHVQYEMFYAGAQFVTAGHSFRTYDWEGATGMVDTLMDSIQLPG